MRHSSFTQLEAQYLLLLEYIDIAFSGVKQADLFDCLYLQNVTADDSQKIYVGISVTVEYIYRTSGFCRTKKASLGSIVKRKIFSQQLSFKENKISGHNQFEEYSLRHCKYVSIRGSFFNRVYTHYLQSLLYIDVTFSAIQDMDLRDCS